MSFRLGCHLFCYTGKFFELPCAIKNAPLGTHCGGDELCRKNDLPQAENLAGEIHFQLYNRKQEEKNYELSR